MGTCSLRFNPPIFRIDCGCCVVVARAAMTSLFGRWENLRDFQTIQDVLLHFGVPVDVWVAWQNQVGNLGSDIRLLAALPKSGLVAACGSAQLADGSAFNPVMATQIGLVWRLARRIVAYAAGVPECDFHDIDPWQEPMTRSSSSNVAPSSSSPPSVKEKILKMSQLIDQADDSELLPPSAVQVNNWLQNYIAVMGSTPEESEEPTPSQLAGLAKRVFGDDVAPYTDFAVFGPYERKLSKTLKCRVYVPLGDGSFLQRELPGPPTYQAWLASWRVLKTSCLMLNIASLASLECYGRHIERLVTQWPSCWGLIYSADDAARAERFDKLRRHFTAESAVGRQVPRDWDPTKPWSCIFSYITKEDAYWSEKVHVPASAWVASGSRGTPVVATEAAVRAHVPGLQDSQDPGGDDRGARKKQSNRDKREARKRRWNSDMSELRTYRQGKGSHEKHDDGGKGPRGGAKGKGKSKDQTGAPLCFSWASKTGPCAAVAPGGDCLCSVKRVHKCRKCLSPAHQDDDCTKA